MHTRTINGTAAARLVLLAAIAVLAGFALLPAGDKEDVLILCGGSMRAVLEDVIERYAELSDDKVIATYGGSGELCAQIEKTGKGDIYICHDPFMAWAAERGMIDTWATVGYLDVVIIAPKGNPKGISGLKDLARPGLRLGVGDRNYSTSGVITTNILEKLDYREDILRNVRMETKGHQQRCNDVSTGLLDASIVWRPVARLFAEKLESIPIPNEYVDSITSASYGKSDLRNVKVTIGITSGAKDKETARSFCKFATDQCGELFAQHGFRIAEK